MFNQKGDRERQAERRKAELLLYTDSDRDKYQGSHILRLEDQSTEKHKSCKKKIQNEERSLGSDTQGVHTCTDNHRRKVGRIKARTDDICTGREYHKVPRDVHIIPLDHTYARDQCYNRTDEHNHLSRNAVPAFCHPQNKNTHENSYGLELFHSHLAHRFEFLTKTLHSTLDLRLFFLRLEREYYLDSHKPSDKQKNHRERESCHQPIRINQAH